MSATLAGAVAVGIVPLGAGTAQAATPPPAQSTTAFCAGVAPEFDPFEDIAGNHFADEILCLAWAGITQGAGAGDPFDRRDAYQPTAAVTRAQMATFIARSMDTAWVLDPVQNIEELLDYAGEDNFSDVDPSSPHFESINRLAEAGIALGGSGTSPASRFDPGQTVTRAQMATFIARADAHLRGRAIPSASDYFVDDEGSTHQPRINAVASLGIATGDGRDRFTPDADVTRAQMSAFLMRTLARLHADGLIPEVWDYLDVPVADLSTVEVTDNGDGSATIAFDLRNYRDEPIEGLPDDMFGLEREGVDELFVDELIAAQPTAWSFTEVGGGVYHVVHTSPTNTSFVVDVVFANFTDLAQDVTVTITGAG